MVSSKKNFKRDSLTRYGILQGTVSMIELLGLCRCSTILCLSNKCVRKDLTMAKASICSKANTGLSISIFSAHKIEAVSLKNKQNFSNNVVNCRYIFSFLFTYYSFQFRVLHSVKHKHFETSSYLRKIKHRTSFLVKK